MAKFLQGGANFTGKPTKKGLKTAIKEAPETVWLYTTSALGESWSGFAPALPDDVKFNVVGPDPYTKRTWYANVRKDPSGALIVS